MKTSEKATLVGFIGLFLSELLLAGDHLPELPGWLFVPVLGLAAYRGGRAVSFNLIFKWLRDLFDVAETPDSSGAGNSNNPTGEGWRYVVGALLCCPICSGTHVASALLLTMAIYRPFGLALMYALAATGVAEVLHWMSEHYAWSGRHQRELSGSQWLIKSGRSHSDNGKSPVPVEVSDDLPVV